MKFLPKLSVALLALSLLSACGGAKDEGNPNNPQSEGGEPGTAPKANPNRVDWKSVPPEFNPNVQDVTFPLDGVQRVRLDVFGFQDDVEVIHSQELAANAAYLRLYSVFRQSASWGSLKPKLDGNEMKLMGVGQYGCSKKIRNGKIEQLDGGCYVRLQVVLPVGAQIEVYNVGHLLTKRYFPVSTEEFLNELGADRTADERLQTIDAYVASYANGAQPAIAAQQLGAVLHVFPMLDDKLKALRKLHSFVTNRDRLADVLDREFNVFDREEAQKITGV